MQPEMEDGSVEVRTGEVDGRRLFVIDDAVERDVIASFYQRLLDVGFKKSETASVETTSYKHWVSELSLTELRRSTLWTATSTALATFWATDKFEPFRAYTNCATFGDMLFTHLDCAEDSSEITALWFICNEWEIEWGGETLFYNSCEDAQFVVSPKPGRLILFDGAIRHVGRPPNRIFFGPRFTFAIKIRARANVTSSAFEQLII